MESGLMEFSYHSMLLVENEAEAQSPFVQKEYKRL